MIHPHAAADAFFSPLHRSFLIGSFVCGGAALFVLPLHLALAGAPHPAVILVLSWMLSQWPIALYLSRSGNLDRVVTLSSSLFACVVACVCLLTGGRESFALVWLIIPPLEAALSTRRKTVAGVSGLCILLLSIILFQPFSLPQFPVLPGAVRFLSTFAAVIYAGSLAMRIAQDRKNAKEAVDQSAKERQFVNEGVSEVLCEVSRNGDAEVLGGPVRQMFGFQAPVAGDDWLFSRLHVADRPLFLTRLSDIRRDGAGSRFEMRMRVGANVPGETGQAEYRTMEFHLRTIEADLEREGAAPRMLLSIRNPEASEHEAGEFPGSQGDAFAGKLSHSLFQTASAEAREAFAEIVARTRQLEDGEATAESIALIRKAGEDGISALTRASGLGPADDETANLECGPVDINSSLERCAVLLRPVAAGFGASIEVEPVRNAPQILGDGKLLRQALCLVLTDMLETSGDGGVVHLSGGAAASGLHIVLSVSNRRSCLRWSAEASRPVLGFANGLFERLGGKLSVQTMLGHGESVVLKLPLRSRHDLAKLPDGLETELGRSTVKSAAGA
ncbi:hypothetical protein FMN50_11245 [Rhodobacterales bacterium]|nr:hypothetical protein FMN50_11245 [Rhodobacterales bacterium]